MLSLREILEIPDIMPYLLDGISNFSCVKNKDLEYFLKNKAVAYEEIAKCRSYLFIDVEALNEDRGIEIIGFFSIGIGTLSIPTNLSNNYLRKLDGYSDKINNERIKFLPAYLIGQLAKSDKYSSFITGDEIIQTAITIIRGFYKNLGGRLIVVDCQPVEILHDFYKRNAFNLIGHNEENNLDQFAYLLNRKQLNFGKIDTF